MKKKIQNKLGTYLAVTAGVGCAASVAEGAIVMVDLTTISTGYGNKSIPGMTGYSMVFPFNGGSEYIATYGGAQFYSDKPGFNGVDHFASGYNAYAVAPFPTDADQYLFWSQTALTSGSGSGLAVGENWVAFKDSSGKFGWMSFTLGSLGANNTNPITSFGHFVYDSASTSPANAIPLQAAVAAVPEPSGLVLLALGATGLAARRQRRKAA